MRYSWRTIIGGWSLAVFFPVAFVQAQSTPDTSIEQAIARGDLKAAIQEVRKLPLEKRLEWIEPLAQVRNQSIPLSTSTSSTSKDSGSRSATLRRAEGSKSSEPTDGNGGHGGGVVADFQSLISLIQGVVEANWDVDGGTDTIQPFSSGVWIDPQGVLQARKKSKELKVGVDASKSVDPIALPGSVAWASPNPLRWVSLTRLEERLRERAKRELPASASMELLGGLARIDYVAWDAESREWLIGGPAGGFELNADGDLIHRDTKLPPVLLEDLLSVAPHVLGQRGVFGCSIDPQPSRLADVQRFLADRNSTNLLTRAPDKWTQQVTELLGPQDVTIMGLPKDSPTGLALLIADQHMKRIGLGLEAGPKGMPDYIRIADQLQSLPGQGLVRWWFAIQPQTIETNDAGSVIAIPRQSVQVLSEREWMDANGKRSATVNRDEAADAFAKTFTSRFEDIQIMYPMYGRLRHIFDLTVAMEIIRREQSNPTERFMSLSQTSVQPHALEHATQVPTITTFRKVSGKQVVAMVSGGVVIKPSDALSQTMVVKQSTMPNVAGLVPEKASDEELNWMLKAPLANR